MNPLAIHSSPSALTCIEICAGAGGQAIGLERARFEALAHVEYDRHACTTLRLNRPKWNVIEGDVREASWRLLKASDFGVLRTQRVLMERESPRSLFRFDEIMMFN